MKKPINDPGTPAVSCKTERTVKSVVKSRKRDGVGHDSFIPFIPSNTVNDLDFALDFVETITKTVKSCTYDNKTYANGDLALRGLISSSSLIFKAHQYIANLFHITGIDANRIQFERNLPTPFDGKNTDVVIFDENFEVNDASIAIGCKSAISSFRKNFNNNFAAGRNDATDFHEYSNKRVVGHVQVVLLREINRAKSVYNEIAWKTPRNVCQQLIRWNHQNGRKFATDPHQLMEAVGLIVIDPCNEKGQCVVYDSIDALVRDGWIAQSELSEYNFLLESLSMSSFAKRILEAHAVRFNRAN